MTNLTLHLLQQHSHSQDARDLASILNQIVFGAKIVSREINKAGLVDILGSTGKVNVHQEEVQKLDQYTNDIFLNLLRQMPQIRAVGSEEMAELSFFTEHQATGSYAVLLDPLDGSSNTDVNVSVGTIFTIVKLKRTGQALTEADVLSSVQNIVAAGYIVYGSSTMLVYSSGKGVHGFTLDPSIGEFLLSHEHMKFPKKGSIYSINESYQPHWDNQLLSYIQEVKTEKDISGTAKSARYIGSLVSDFHRNLIKGGIYLYPADTKHPRGKLRLLFEAIPFAFLAAQAGGDASDGTQGILEIPADSLHQKTPLFVGNKEDVARVVNVLAMS